MGDDGYWPCNLRQGRQKRSYPTIDEAWRTAFLLWATGRIDSMLVPYHCNAARMWIGEPGRVQAQRNPWRWSPAWVVGPIRMRRITNRSNRKNRCNLWHLTRSHAHMLSNPENAPHG